MKHVNTPAKRYFKTSDILTATYLFALEQQLAGLDVSNPKRIKFTFINTPLLSELVANFKFARPSDQSCQVNAKKLFAAFNQLKQLIYSEKHM